MSLYASDGTINVTVVTGASYTGLYAADGSLNVVEDLGTTLLGLYHPCGALNVKVVDNIAFYSFYSANGSMNVYLGNNRTTGATPVTVVSGALGSRAATLLALEPQGLAISFMDQPFFSTTGYYGSLVIKDTSTPSNNYSSHPFGKLTYSSPSAKWTLRSDGNISKWTAGLDLPYEWTASGDPAGIRAEHAATNHLLWCRDLTNAAYTPVNCTVTAGAVGVDGVISSASILTATAANATVLQSITRASSVRITSAYVKRRSGTGVIEMTQDNGTTWTAINPILFVWTRFVIPSATLANPIIGFRIQTSGDQIDVDLLQHEETSYISSPIETTTAAATRAVDAITLATTLFPFGGTERTLLVRYVTPPANYWLSTMDLIALRAATFAECFIHYLTGTTDFYGVNRVASAAEGFCNISHATAASTEYKVALAGTTNDYQTAVNGTVSAVDSSGIYAATLTNLHLGTISFSAGTFNKLIKEVMVVPRRMTQAEIDAWTTI